jgi:hypothetical protein
MVSQVTASVQFLSAEAHTRKEKPRFSLEQHAVALEQVALILEALILSRG